MMAGGDLFMLSHPATIRIIKRLIEILYGEVDVDQRIQDWITDIGL